MDRRASPPEEPQADRPAPEETLLSVVAPVLDEAGGIVEFHRRVAAAVADLHAEIVLVDDGSSDGTGVLLRAIAHDDPRVRVLTLSRNFGHQAALTAGLDHARGRIVVMLDSDLQDPPELIPDMVARWREGCDVVTAVRRGREQESAFKRGTAHVFYRVFSRIASIDALEDAGDFRLLDRRALDVLLSMRERTRFLRGMTSWIGFRQGTVEYTRAGRYADKTKFTLRRMVAFSLDALLSFSRAPLQVVMWFGFAVSLAAFLAIPIIVALRLLGHYMPGFGTLTIAVLLLGGIQLIAIGVLGEYLARIFEEVKARPLYVVRDDEADDGDEGPRAR